MGNVFLKKVFIFVWLTGFLVALFFGVKNGFFSNAYGLTSLSGSIFDYLSGAVVEQRYYYDFLQVSGIESGATINEFFTNINPNWLIKVIPFAGAGGQVGEFYDVYDFDGRLLFRALATCNSEQTVCRIEQVRITSPRLVSSGGIGVGSSYASLSLEREVVTSNFLEGSVVAIDSNNVQYFFSNHYLSNTYSVDETSSYNLSIPAKAVIEEIRISYQSN